MENNSTRIRSQLLRSVRLMRAARGAAKAAPGNVGATSRRRDRTLAAWAVSRKAVAAKAGTGLRGAAKNARRKRAARNYIVALRRWQENYRGGHAL
jgi:hypothetical protein